MTGLAVAVLSYGYFQDFGHDSVIRGGAGCHGPPRSLNLDGTRTRIFRFVKAALYPLSYKELAISIAEAWQCSAPSPVPFPRVGSPLAHRA